MKPISWITMALVCFLIFGSGCEQTKEPIEFTTSAEAEASYEQLQGSQSDPVEVVNKVLEAASLSESFDGSADVGKRRIGKRSSLKKVQSFSFTYDGNTGYWTLDADTVENGANISLFYQVRYTPRSIFGFATEFTDRMEYETTVHIDGVVSDTTDTTITSVDVDLNYSENYDIQSDEPFVTNTNFITITGSTGATSTFEANDITVTADYQYDVSALKIFGPYNDAEEEPEYPESGSIHFTVDYSLTGTNFSASYFVEGTITFDGDNTALLEYGGHSFILNLDDGSVTPL